MSETIGSRFCETGEHLRCLGCAGCQCHARPGSVSDWPGPAPMRYRVEVVPDAPVAGY